jgi:DNA repair exonuclease SbcCD ATPase subunit
MNRRTLADNIDALDEKIAELQREKAEFYAAYREDYENKGHHKEDVKLECAAVKAAIRQRQKLAKDKDAVVERGDRIDTILDEITRATKNNAPAATPAPAIANVEAPTRARASDDLEIPEFLRA